MARLTGRRIIVTGAASGIGAATVRRFVAEGAKVAAFDRDAAGLTALTDAVEGVFAVRCDFLIPDDLEAQVAGAIAELGGIDGLANCAGMDGISSIEEGGAGLWHDIMTVNVVAPMMMARYALRSMAENGSIVQVASSAGLRPLPHRTAYCASKAAIIMATKALALEIAPRKIRANALCPGVIDTPMLRSGWKDAADPEAALAEIRSRNAMQRIGTAGEVAEGMLFLMSDEASFVTGSVMTVDGGRAFH